MSAKHRRLARTRQLQSNRRLRWVYVDSPQGGFCMLSDGRGGPQYHLYCSDSVPAPFGSTVEAVATDVRVQRVMLRDYFKREITP